MAVAAKKLHDETKVLSPFMTARDNLVEALKGKRFGLMGFDPEETQALRSAIDFASARTHSITEDPRHPGLMTLTPFDGCVMNLSSEVAKAAGGAVDLLSLSRKPTVIIGERDEVQTEAVGTAGLALDEPAAFQRGEQPRCGARVDAGSAGELVDAEAGIARRECVEQRERAPDRSDRTRDASRSRLLRSQRPVLAARRWRRRRPSCEEFVVATRSGLADSSDRITWTWIPAGANRSRE